MFFKRPQYFPKQLFFRFVLQQILGVVPTLLIAALATRAYLSSRNDHFATVADAATAYDRAFLFLALVMATTVSGITFWTGYRLIWPLGRVLVKARSILKRDYQQASARDDDNTAATGLMEPNEWSDLEATLHKIGDDLQSTNRSLSREREEIEAIMSALTEGVVAVDKMGNLLFFNSRFVLLFGPDRQRGGRLSDFIRSPDVLEAFRATLKDGNPRQVNTQLRLKEDVVPRTFSLSIAPLRLKSELNTYGAVGIFHDVTELKRMDQVRIDFVANVSHELRSPLTSIKGYVETLLEDAPQGSPSRRYLETIERNTNRLIALVHDLLNLSSLESGAELERSEVDLKELTQRVCTQLESQRAAKDIHITSDVQAPYLWADPKRLEQVLVNLVENAIKYIPAKGKIHVQWLRKGGEVELHVTDDGPGIPYEHQARVFERFYRVDSARSREQGGTGLGLAIVKHIIQRHGGRVKVQGGPGQGSEFLCFFPAEREA
jgi:two-component system, OmpR family, phosphate regulon sensor histidine kinase PhoR